MINYCRVVSNCLSAELQLLFTSMLVACESAVQQKLGLEVCGRNSCVIFVLAPALLLPVCYQVSAGHHCSQGSRYCMACVSTPHPPHCKVNCQRNHWQICRRQHWIEENCWYNQLFSLCWGIDIVNLSHNTIMWSFFSWFLVICMFTASAFKLWLYTNLAELVQNTT